MQVMEEEFEEFVVESVLGQEQEIDPNYEFDAPRFCDFSQPETHWDAVEAEQWFESAGSYPPSPLVLKVRWGKFSPSGIVYTSTDCRDDKSSKIVNDNSGHSMEYEVPVDGESTGKTKSLSKSSGSKSSTLMKPTASHLAKQRNPPGAVTTTRTLTRSPSQNSSIDDKETKRQKLEAGYLRKAAHLKHHVPYTHKTAKKQTEVNSPSRPKVTVPKEFDLETANRAEKNKSRNNTESGGNRKSSSQTFKALPLNKKILEAPSLSFRKKKTPQLTEFHVFHLKTSERAMQHTSSNDGHNSNRSSSSNRETKDSRRQNSAADARQEKCRPVNKLRGSSETMKLSNKGERGVFRNIKQENVMGKSCVNEPPTELFNKLSLASEVKETTKSQSKEKPTSKDYSKENRPGYFQLEHERINYIKEEMQRPCGKQYHQFMNDASMLAGVCTFG